MVKRRLWRGGRSLRKDFRRTVRRSLARFMSLLLIVFLAVTFFVGLRQTAPNMRQTADTFYDEQQLFDLRLISTLGLEESDLPAIASVEGVDQVMGAHTTDVYVEAGDSILVLRLHSLPADLTASDALNVPLLQQGRWPQTEDEVLIDHNAMERLGYTLGQRLSLNLPEETAFRLSELTLVGTVISPYHLTELSEPSSLGSGSINAWLYAPMSAFESDYFSEIYLTVAGSTAVDSYSDEYQTLVEPVKERLEDYLPELVAERRARIVSDAEEEIRKGEDELADAEAEAELELRDAKKELQQGQTDWDAGLADYEAGRLELEEAQNEGEAELEAARLRLDQSRTALTQGQAEFDAAEPDALSELAAAEQQLNAGQAALAQGWLDLAAGKEEWLAGQAELELRASELASGWQQYEAGLADYETAWAAYQSGLDLLLAGILAQDPTATVQDLPSARVWYQTQLQLLDEGEVLPAADEAAARLALQELDAGLTELEVALPPLEAARTALDQSLLELQEGEHLLSVGRDELEEGRLELVTAEETLNREEEQLAAAELAYEAGVKELEGGRRELAEGWTALRQGEADYAAGLAEFEEEISQAESDLAAGWQELEESRIELEDGWAEYNTAEAEAQRRLSEARGELRDARAEVREIAEGEGLVLDRDTNPGIYSYGLDAQRMENISLFIPIIFFVVAGMISLTAMTRMVESDRTLIGMERALGFRLSGLMWKYMAYALLAALIGGVLGVFASRALPWVIFNSYQLLYTLPPLQMPMAPSVAAAGIGAAVLSLLVGVVIAALDIMRSPPAALMRPPAPRLGKKIWLERIRPLWKRLSFSYKVSLRNLFRYKKRLFMTLFGIGGCTGLLLMGFGLRNSLNSMMTRQYGDITHHDAVISIGESFDPEGREADELDRLLAELPGETAKLFAYEETINVSSPDLSGAEPEVTLFVAQNEIEQMISLRQLGSETPLALDDEGVIITEKLARILGVKAGDELSLLPYQGINGNVMGEMYNLVTEDLSLKVSGVTEAYIGHTIYMSSPLVEKLFAGQPEANRLYIRNPEALDREIAVDKDDKAGLTVHERRQDELAAQLLEIDGVGEVNYVDRMVDDYSESLDRLQIVVFIIVAAAGALAALVLYNLNTINIAERRRELATLRVLGFTDREMTAYIFRENLILSLLGIALGLGLGILLNNYLIASVEIDMMYFSREIHWTSYLLSIGLTLLFSLGVNLVMRKQIIRIDMVESLKSVE